MLPYGAMRTFFASARLPLTLLSLAASGCTWISNKDVEDRLSVVDDDGDGFAAAKDCNDADAAVNPGAVEAYYDGIDQDCAADDDYDADKDGFVADTYLGLTTGGVNGSGALPGGDCNDADGAISPDATEVFHDGVDQDCAADDDYDQDVDGFVADADAGKATGGVPSSGALPGGDCDDTLADVNPDAPDVPYNGVDSDCGGNDDYDFDGDGFYDSAHNATYGPTTYVDGSGMLPGDDCDDHDDQIFPDAPDAWYDGVDANCDNADDYDQDVDGYRSANAGWDDCDDTASSVHPGGYERLSDSVDQDCDGDANRFTLGTVGGITWTEAHDPLFATNSDHIFLSVPDALLTYDGDRFWDSAAAISWDSAAPHDDPTVYLWNSNTDDPSTFQIGDGQGFAVTDQYIYGVLALDVSSGHGLRFIRYDMNAGTRSGVNVQSIGVGVYPYTDLSLAVDGGTLYAAAADDGGNLTFARVDDITSGQYAVNHEESIGVDLVAMTLSGSVPIYGNVGDELWGFDFDADGAELPFSASVISSAVDISDLDMTDDLGVPWLVQAMPTSGVIRLKNVETGAVTDIAAADVEDVSITQSPTTSVWYIAWSDTLGDAHLSYGSSLSALTTVDWDLPGASAEVAAGSIGGSVWMAVVADGVATAGQVEE